VEEVMIEGIVVAAACLFLFWRLVRLIDRASR
jgi:hypothetical protein